ncbi:hypothetical protein [Sphingomonas bacterium]|uniref:hypothetical protein n=1 Tax=Sphingomonas bacterium TaxID=1895847 RepID=UPI002620B1E9|nr:hypothetical protein [Sphingomonas bacterium]MDB5678549.1 hypothetical protein [Sphingomonas bacterium]
MKSVLIVITAAIAAAAATAAAQTATPSVPVTAAAPVPATPNSPAVAAPPFARGVPSMTVVTIEILVPLNSKTNHIGDTFPIKLVDPVLGPTGEVLLPSGTMGQGEVIHAARARALGKAGEMILAARYFRCGAVQVPLGHFKFGVAGHDNTGTVMALTIAVSPLAAFIAGGEVNIPPGTRAIAKITADVALTAEASASCLGSAQ